MAGNTVSMVKKVYNQSTDARKATVTEDVLDKFGKQAVNPRECACEADATEAVLTRFGKRKASMHTADATEDVLAAGNPKQARKADVVRKTGGQSQSKQRHMCRARSRGGFGQVVASHARSRELTDRPPDRPDGW